VYCTGHWALGGIILDIEAASGTSDTAFALALALDSLELAMFSVQAVASALEIDFLPCTKGCTLQPSA